MRRKSERTASKKAKSSPEKVEKVKRTRTRRKKQSTSSENESADENSSVQEIETVIEVEKKPPQTPGKEVSPEEAQDQVWQVKTPEGSKDTGEIQKLKICLTRPPSTPERVDRSPRSKRKHSRATSSSDTPSIDIAEDKKKGKHRSKRAARESKDESEKNHDSQGDEPEVETTIQLVAEEATDEVIQNTETQQENVADEIPMSTTNDEAKIDESAKGNETSGNSKQLHAESCKSEELSLDGEIQGKLSDADTTVVSPKPDSVENQTEIVASSDRDNQLHEKIVPEEMSEVSEIQSEVKICESSVALENDHQKEESTVDERDEALSGKEVSRTEGKTNNASEQAESSQNEIITATNDNDVVATNETNDVVESCENVKNETTRDIPADSGKDNDVEDCKSESKSKELETSDSIQSTQEESIHNGQVAPIVVNRKRRWGSRPSKVTTQKSITISTDVLKEIIPDVKPVEFNEVIEEKRHKRVEMSEKVERPVLPKIVIDNTEHVEQHKKEYEDKDVENEKARESNLALNRKISIIKENDSIITRPPSPPRHKQSCILYITNLVRPFTLPQLKNLLQRTGRIVEDGFWIDRIKSKCYVKYDTEDQAVETRHALHGVTWPVSNPKTLQVDFSTQEAFDKAKLNEETENTQTSSIPGTVEDWLREQDMKRERGEMEKPWERKAVVREWDVGKNEQDKDKLRRDDRPLEKRRHRTPERSPEPAKKFKKKEEEAPAKLLDDLFRKTKTTPCIYWLPLSAETIAIKEEQRRQHMAEHERRLQELRRTHRRH